MDALGQAWVCKAVSAFTQFDQDTYDQGRVGLGSAIAQYLVKVLGGQLAIERIPDQQTIMRGTLPAE